MRYFYEYKYKSGCKFGGHNLEEIKIYDNFILLKGVDILLTYNGYEYQYFTQTININEIEYLKINPME